jgi:hypothetical protein
MKHSPDDYTLHDVEEYIAKIHGLTLNQVMARDFPAPDYLDNDEPVWRFETVYAWLNIFHTALHVSEAAADPEGFERFVGTLRELMQAREQGPVPDALIDETELAIELGLATGNPTPAEDQTRIEAGKVSGAGAETLDRYSAVNFANIVGYASMHTFDADRKKGILPPPDGVFNGSPYWHRETIERFRGGAR